MTRFAASVFAGLFLATVPILGCRQSGISKKASEVRRSEVVAVVLEHHGTFQESRSSTLIDDTIRGLLVAKADTGKSSEAYLYLVRRPPAKPIFFIIKLDGAAEHYGPGLGAALSDLRASPKVPKSSAPAWMLELWRNKE